MDCLMLRLDAPLMSFGSVVVDQINPVDRFPGRSLLSGLLGNALGLDHADTAALARLQQRLRHASRWDAEPELLVDYQTVDLGQDFMQDTGWTTRGRREDRGKGDATRGTHQRWRHYWANGSVTVAMMLADAGATDDPLCLELIASALRRPARPLFIGRKTCIPAEPLLLGHRSAPSLRAALCAEPLAAARGRRVPARVPACWPEEEGAGAATLMLDDLRDWPNNLHRGRQRYATGFLEIAP
ncbi:MAG: type I-E CRISPR-associated protein Cas5/CasD [Gammaproteobacteria bacterium]